MKNGLFAFIFIIAVGATGHLGLPWWAMAPVGAVAALLFPQPPARSFATGFAAGSLLWYISAFILNAQNAGMLSAKVGQLFLGIKGIHLLFITGGLGGVLTGLGALTGALLRSIFTDRKPQRYRGKKTTYKF